MSGPLFMRRGIYSVSSTAGRSFSSMVSSIASATQINHTIAASVLAQTPATCTAHPLFRGRHVQDERFAIELTEATAVIGASLHCYSGARKVIVSEAEINLNQRRAVESEHRTPYDVPCPRHSRPFIIRGPVVQFWNCGDLVKVHASSTVKTSPKIPL